MDKQLWCIHALEYYTVMKRNELSSHEKTGRNLKSMLLNEKNQSEKTTNCGISTIWHSGEGKSTEVEMGEGRINRWSTEYIESSETILFEYIESSKTILFDTVVMDTYHYTYFKTYKMYNTKSEL